LGVENPRKKWTLYEVGVEFFSSTEVDSSRGGLRQLKRKGELIRKAKPKALKEGGEKRQSWQGGNEKDH